MRSVRAQTAKTEYSKNWRSRSYLSIFVAQITIICEKLFRLVEHCIGSSLCLRNVDENIMLIPKDYNLWVMDKTACH